MSKRKKLLEKLRAVEGSGANWQDVETLALRYGFTLNHVHGSHHIYVLIDENGDPHTFSIPVHGTKVKPIYVLNLVRLIDKVFPEG